MEDDDVGNGDRKLGLTFDLEFSLEECRFDSSRETLRSLFDQVLIDFLRDMCVSKCIRPIPVLCGDGRPVDLFKLFWVVRKIGGFSIVSRNYLWGFVSEECGLDLRLIPSVKLIYIKYLNEFDQWVSSKTYLEDRHNSLIRKLDLLSQELEIGELDADIKCCENDDFVASVKKVMNEANVFAVDNSGNENKVINKVRNCEKTIASDDDDDDNNVLLSATRVVENTITKAHFEQNKLGSRKRKRESESFQGVLKWLLYVAKHSNDPSIGLIPEYSKWNEYGNEQLWVQAILVRDALMVTSNANSNAGENLLKDEQKKPRMHPSMYIDDRQCIEKLRCSKRIAIPSPRKSHFCRCCNSSQSKNIIPLEAKVGNNSPKSPLKSPPTNSNNKLFDMAVERLVSVGPRFQAEVPEWTGVPSESDLKWLGTRMCCACEDGDQNSNVIQRRPPCDCPFQDSVECVRFHIAEKRLKLKRELGSLFYKWGFDRMGEEVSLSWSEEEEKKFKDMMRSTSYAAAAFSNKFWSKFLPSKTRIKLVSYYFNVFLVQRRTYQNRVTPKDVDSDNDEKECGSIGASFGYKALSIPGSNLISCTLNQESTESRG